jgi:hypothetical protein
MKNLITWAELPANAEDESKFLVTKDVVELADSFLEMLFQFKHRGAIQITADSFELFMKKMILNPSLKD